MTVRFAWCLVALTLLGGCVETALVCGPGLVRSPDGCVADPVDSGRDRDGGRDANVPVDGGPCDPACTGGEVCVEIDEDTFACVECASDAECGDRYCGAGHACVDCTEHAHCTDPEAGQCLDGSCAPCAAPDHCAGTTGTICDASRTPATCVECTLANASACSAPETCDLLAGECVNLTNRQNCETCTNDMQCASGLRCVRMEYPAGTARTTGHCLRPASPSCPVQHFAQPIDRPSLNGVAGTYCGVNEALTTCEAVLALEANQTCSSDAACPESGLCRTLGVLPGMFCTYRCSSATQCFATTVDANKDSCADGGTGGGTPYCGG